MMQSTVSRTAGALARALPSASPTQRCGPARHPVPGSIRTRKAAGRRPVQVQAFFDFLKKKGAAPAEVARPVRPTVIPEQAFNIPAVLLGLAGLSAIEGWTPAAGLFGLLGVFLGVQATRVRFVFDDEALEVKVGADLEESGDNAFVGGANRWSYDSFVNWEFWWPGFPVLVYFKETQTKEEGQIHFFPVIFNGKQLYDVMAERCGPSQTSGPKE